MLVWDFFFQNPRCWVLFLPKLELFCVWKPRKAFLVVANILPLSLTGSSLANDLVISKKKILFVWSIKKSSKMMQITDFQSNVFYNFEFIINSNFLHSNSCDEWNIDSIVSQYSRCLINLWVILFTFFQKSELGWRDLESLFYFWVYYFCSTKDYWRLEM